MKKVLALLICISSFSIFAQGEANNWYFGRNAGITFNTDPPSALTDGELNTPEGCSSISDVNGNLLMYTDGRTIWNRNHEIMSNANYFGGTGLHGDPSSTSSGLIVPHPTNPSLYYVFTIDEPHHDNANAYPNQGPADSNGNPIIFYTDTQQSVPVADDGFNNGLNYSIVDMTLNGGLGNVVTGERNNQLITYDTTDSEEIKYKASEKITAVSGRDCNSVWLITHFRNKFYAFFIDDNGINETPIISTVEPLLEITDYRRAALGYMKASPTANKLLTANNTTNYDPEDINQDAGDGNVYAYDFDNLTGVVTNPVKLIDDVNAYGVEFSQDGTKAYATVNDTIAKLYQWDLNANNIPNSIENIANLGFNASGALQLGPDGKIYHSILNSTTLGVINNPDETGSAVNYSQNEFGGALSLNGRITTFGLPPFIQSLFSKRIPIIETESGEIKEQIEVCDTLTFQLSFEEITGATYTWFKEGVVLPNETGNTLTINQDPNANFPIQENYSLEVDLNNGECPSIGVARVIFNQSPPFEDGELLACTENGNDAIYDLSEINSTLINQVGINPSDLETEFYRNPADAELGNNPIEISSDFINTENLTSITVKISTNGICEKFVEFKLINKEFPDIDLNTEVLTYCAANSPQTLTINAIDEGEDPTLYEYLWSTGETSSSIVVNSVGDYSVDITFDGEDCPVTKTFQVEESQPSFTSKTINLCDTFQYTIEQDEFEEGTFTWFQNGNLVSGETNSSLVANFPQDADFPISNIYTLEVDLEDGSCIKTFEFDITFNKSPDYNSVNLETCDNSGLGYGIFNLENSKIELVEGVSEVSAGDISIEFYRFREDALNAENEIENPQNFENTTNLDRVYGIVEGFESCQTLIEIQLFTFSFPNTDPQKEFLIYCLEGFPETIELDALISENNSSTYDFSWSTSETSQTIEVNQAGLYTVEVSSPNFDCSFIKEFEVRESNIADFDHTVNRFDNVSTVEISIDPSNLGDYEFAINEPEDFQDSNSFENLIPGIYSFFVRDKFGCGISQKTVGVLGVMKFFTPNGDGVNDIWQISGLLAGNQENILVHIYDRYGKLIKFFTNNDRGWDGTYNGKRMPSDDYWYKIRLTDGTIETGNFTLKR